MRLIDTRAQTQTQVFKFQNHILPIAQTASASGIFTNIFIHSKPFSFETWSPGNTSSVYSLSLVLFCTINKQYFTDEETGIHIRGQTCNRNSHLFSQWQWFPSPTLWPFNTMLASQISLSDGSNGHYKGNNYWMIHRLHKDSLSTYYAPCIVLCGVGGRCKAA